MTTDDEEFRARWHMLQEQYRRLLEDWRTYPAPKDEARDRGRQLGRVNNPNGDLPCG